MKKTLLFLLLYILIVCSALIAAGSGSTFFAAVLANPLYEVLFLAAGAGILSFAYGIISADYSWVDRMWSVLPAVFAWIYTIHSNMNPLLLVQAIIITLWALRLSFNFARKGGYSGTEDYRWAILRDRIRQPLLWQLFHLFFINVFQIGLFVLFTLPMYAFYRANISAPGTLFYLFSLLMIAALLWETAADQQQWNFHRQKKLEPESSDSRSGFLSRGLFRYCRHPNYFGELSFWWFHYLAAAAVQGFMNISLSGPVLLTLLFIGSTRFTEAVTASKYPEYRSYQKKTSAIIPFFQRNG